MPQKEDAQQIVAAVGDNAGGAVAIDNATLRAPKPPLVTTGVEFAPNDGFTLRLQSPKDPTRFLEWPQVDVVSAGQFTEEIIQRAAAGDEKKTGAMLLGMGVFLAAAFRQACWAAVARKRRRKRNPRKSPAPSPLDGSSRPPGEQFVFRPEHFDFAGLADKKQLNKRPASACFWPSWPA